jgi:hypothetical protein
MIENTKLSGIWTRLRVSPTTGSWGKTPTLGETPHRLGTSSAPDLSVA